MEWSNAIIALLLLLMVTSKNQLAALRHSTGIEEKKKKGIVEWLPGRHDDEAAWSSLSSCRRRGSSVST